MSRLISLTVADKPEKAVHLIKSFERHEHTFVVLGAGQPWHGGDMVSYGGGQKIVLMKEYLNSNVFDDDDIILFTDGFDSFVCAEPTEFLKKWKQFRCDIVFGAESVNWPGFVNGQEKHSSNKTRFVYLNSGGYIGRANALKYLFNSKEITNSDDDQGYCQELFVTNSVEQTQERKWSVCLDVKKRIFCCLSDHIKNQDVKKLKFANDGPSIWHVAETNSYPLQLHGNGPGKDFWFKCVKEEKLQ